MNINCLKYFLSFFAFCFFINPVIAQDKVADVLAIYRSKAIPYLEEMAKKEFNTKTANASTIARQSALEAKIDYRIKSEVTESCKKNKITDDPKAISLITETAYKQNFTGLPKAFYDSAKEDSQKL
jgi:hypothetical protein